MLSSCCIASLICSYYSTSGEFLDCMGWRRGESCLGHIFVFVLLFIFSHGWAYYASADFILEGCTHSELD